MGGACSKLDTLISKASKILHNCIDSCGEITSLGAETGFAIGLFDGWSGAALAAHIMHIITNDNTWKVKRDVCFEKEIAQLSTGLDGSLYVDLSGIDFGYISEGSAGILWALKFCDPSQYKEEIRRLSKRIYTEVNLNGGLFHGGIGRLLAYCNLSPDCRRFLEGQFKQSIEPFIFTRTGKDKKELFFIGDGGARISSDYSSGAAGVMGCLLSIEAGENLWFPISIESLIKPKERR